ncbi:MAG: TetR/AcrR family transcriptional regulator [Candidatus Dormibacteraceae bacterium]
MRDLRAVARPAPGRHRRVAKAPDDRRQDILAAGLDLFRTIGFGDSTIADIATRAGIAKGTFYLYFDSKDDLLGVLWEAYVDDLVRKGAEVLSLEDDWWPTMDRLWAVLIEHAAQHAELHRIVYGGANGRARELCKQSSQRIIDLLSLYVMRGADEGAFQSDDVRLTSRLVYLAAEGLLDDIGRHEKIVDPAPIVAAVQELCHRALADPALLPR